MKSSGKVKLLHKPIRVLLQSLHYSSVIASLVVNVCFVLAIVSPYISPASLLLPAYFGLGFPFFIVAEFVVLIYWLVRFKGLWLALNILLIICSLPCIRAYIPMNGQQTDLVNSDSTRQLRVLSYNVMAFGFEKHSPELPNTILTYIKHCDADIVCLQEAMLTEKNGSAGGYVNKSTIQHYLPQYRYIVHTQAQTDRGSSLILLSKYPVLHEEHIPYPSDFNGSMAYVLKIRGREVLVLNNHLESFRLTMRDGREYLKLAREGEANTLRRQMNMKLGSAFVIRANAADAVHRYIESKGIKDIIVCGDFNDTPVSYAHHRISIGLTDAYTQCGRGPGFSFNRRRWPFRIDYIMCSRTFEPLRCYVDASIRTSDHYPIIGTLRFR